MAKRADDSPDRDRQGEEPAREAGEQRVLDLLDALHELEQFRREQLTVRKLGAYLRTALTRHEAYAAVERFGPRLWPAATGAVYALHATGEYLERVASWGDTALNAPSFAANDCWAVRRAQPHAVSDAGGEPPCGHAAQVPGALPSLCVPLMARGQMFGLLHLQRLPKIPKISDRELPENGGVAWNMHPALMVAEDLGLALAAIGLQESLREQSIRDALTGLFNRRVVDEFLIRELARAGRRAHQLSLLVLDIDHFKRINDTFGHSAGDMVLRRVGHILQAHVRKSDVACRIGGEEFSLLLAESSLAIAIQRAEDIRKALREMSLAYEDKVLGPITASFGAAAYPEHGRTGEALFRAADEALYHAKRSGRDRVVTAGSPA